MKISFKTLPCLIATVTGLSAFPLRSDSFIPLVDMVSAGAENWSWGGARMKETPEGLVVKESNREGGYGDVYYSTRLPLLPRGQVELKASPGLGAYTLQIMGYQGEQSVFRYEPVKQAADNTPHSISMADLDIPEEVDSLLFKFWVVDAENASTRIQVLRYGVLIPGDQPPERGSWEAPEGWQTDNAEITASESGISVSIGKEKDHGAVVWSTFIPRIEGTWLVHLPEVKNTPVKLTLPAFDQAGSYLGSVNTPLSLKAGWNAVNLTKLAWPEGAVSFQPKFWIENAVGSVTLREWILVP